MGFFKKEKPRIKNDDFVGINRKELLSSDERYGTEKGYCADFTGCTAYYGFIVRSVPNIKGSTTFNLSPKMENNSLTGRNLACLENTVYAAYQRDKETYWHELSDFIHNYSSENAVSIDECRIFVKLYELGVSLWGKTQRKERERNEESPAMGGFKARQEALKSKIDEHIKSQEQDRNYSHDR